ncbi:MAG: hypothetical protein R3B70_46255, partial [Polyangiaceae bacterium]
MIRAVVIGVEQYPGLRAGVLSFGSVPGAVDDAMSFRAFLIEREGLAPEEVSLPLAPASADWEAMPATRGAFL